MTDKPKKTRSVLTCDILAARHIDPKDLARERELMGLCWWEYRGVHPSRRTQLFANTYRRLYQRYYGKYFDYSRAEMVSGLVGSEDIFDLDFSHVAEPTRRERLSKSKRTALTGLWRARQAADELGISYTVYIGAIFEHACARWRNMATKDHLRLPKPTHLYSDRHKVVALDQQAKEIEGSIPEFRNTGLKLGSTAPYKQDFDLWLFELGKLRRIHKDMAFARMVALGYIDEATAASWEVAARD